MKTICATGMSGAEAACSVHENPSGCPRAKSDLSDFHELRRGFIPAESMSIRTDESRDT